jgi:hypothetical protein
LHFGKYRVTIYTIKGEGMIEGNFEYTKELLKKINVRATSKSSLVSEIAIAVILVGAIVAFMLDNLFVGISLTVISVSLIIGLVFLAKTISDSNSGLLGQKVRVVFEEDKINMYGIQERSTIYNATFEYKAIKKVEIKNDLIYIYFGRNTVIIVPKYSFKTAEECEKVIEIVSNNYVV